MMRSRGVIGQEFIVVVGHCCWAFSVSRGIDRVEMSHGHEMSLSRERVEKELSSEMR
jgi:hypothetical protein